MFYTDLFKDGPKNCYVTVFPESSYSAKGEKTWNAGTCCGEAYEEQIDDLGYFQEMIRLLPDFADKNNIFVLGTSNGGAMSIRLGC